MYALAAAIPEPISPYRGTSSRLRTTLIRGCGACDHPVELRPLRAPDADRHHDVARERDPAEGEQRHDPPALVVLRRREQADEPGREKPERERQPRRGGDEVGEHEGVRPLRLVVVLDRVGEGGPGHPERRDQEHHRRGDPHPELVAPDLGGADELVQEEAIAEVERDQGERRRHERDPEAVHLAQQRPRELEAELGAPVAEEREVDDERAEEVADDHPERALVVGDDEDERRRDGDGDVGEARGDEEARALLDAEERGQLLVVHLRPDPDERGADEVRVVEQEQVGERLREQRPRPRARLSRSPS